MVGVLGPALGSGSAGEQVETVETVVGRASQAVLSAAKWQLVKTRATAYPHTSCNAATRGSISQCAKSCHIYAGTYLICADSRFAAS